VSEPLAPRRTAALGPETIQRLDAYTRDVLGCDRRLIRHAGLTVAPLAMRGQPGWKGFVLPVVAITVPEGTLVTARPDLLSALETALGTDRELKQIDLAALRRLKRAMTQVSAHAFILGGEMRTVERGLFTPVPGEHRAEQVERQDPLAAHLWRQVDGALFAVRGPHGRPVSWAGIKMKSEDVWEIAVATEPDYRGRGYARDTVSAATRHVLEAGKLPLYIYDRDNDTSAFVCRSLGYRRYAEITFAEY
jgi:RimJ/RimL family protein N-acetyltransferase